MAKNLSTRQADIVWKMQHGWQLAWHGYCAITSAPNIVLQRGGIGSGGELNHPTVATLKALLRAGFITGTNGTDLSQCDFRLTDAGQKVNAA